MTVNEPVAPEAAPLPVPPLPPKQEARRWGLLRGGRPPTAVAQISASSEHGGSWAGRSGGQSEDRYPTVPMAAACFSYYNPGEPVIMNNIIL